MLKIADHFLKIVAPELASILFVALTCLNTFLDSFSQSQVSIHL